MCLVLLLALSLGRDGFELKLIDETEAVTVVRFVNVLVGLAKFPRGVGTVVWGLLGMFCFLATFFFLGSSCTG